MQTRRAKCTLWQSRDPIRFVPLLSFFFPPAVVTILAVHLVVLLVGSVLYFYRETKGLAELRVSAAFARLPIGE